MTEPAVPALPPPRGCSPTLGVRRLAVGGERRTVLALLFAGCAGLAAWQHAAGASVVAVAIVYGALFALVAASVVRSEISVGADWLRRVVPFGTSCVRTTELVAASVATTPAGTRVSFADARGRRLHARLDDLADTPAVWGPLHAALAASLASGTLRVDARARRALGLSDQR